MCLFWRQIHIYVHLRTCFLCYKEEKQRENLLSISAGSVCVRSRWKVATHGAEQRSCQGSRRVKTIHLLFRTGVNFQAPLCCGWTQQERRAVECVFVCVCVWGGGPHPAASLTRGGRHCSHAAGCKRRRSFTRAETVIGSGRLTLRFFPPVCVCV